MNEKKPFVEPEVVKCEETLDKVTLCFNSYGDKDNRDDWDPWERHKPHKRRKKRH